MGHALNKILKDIIVKSRHLAGLQAPYVPGWDCHGLPIEHKVSQELKAKGKENLPAVTVRRLCRDYAKKFVDIQRKEFQRLGVFGDWDDPYLTMRPSYETATALALCDFVENGSVYRGKKPIHWCLSCKTALAEAEVEYADETSPSVFVRFPPARPENPGRLPHGRSGEDLRRHLDHHALDPAGQHGRGRPSRIRLRAGRRRRRPVRPWPGSCLIPCGNSSAGPTRPSWPRPGARPWKASWPAIPFTTGPRPWSPPTT